MSGRVKVAGYDVLEDAGSIVCRHLIEGGEVRLFSHDDDGVMQFLCGCKVKADSAMVVHIGHVLEWHPDMADLPVIAPGFWAERIERGAPWIVRPQSEED